MLKLQVKEPGEYLMIGDDIKVIFTGWTKNYLRIMVEAPKEINVVRSKAAEKAGTAEPGRYLSEKEMKQMQRIVRQESSDLIRSGQKNVKPQNNGQQNNRKKKAVIVTAR